MKLIFSTIVLSMAQLAFAAVSQVQPKTSRIEFVAKGKPAFISITGEAPFNDGGLVLADDKLSGMLTVPLKLITTGIDLRDEHLKDKYLEVATFPDATLTLDGVSLQGETFEGKLTLHGVEQKISGTKELTTKGDMTRVNATFVVKLTDFKIAIPSFQGITVADVVTVNTELTLKETK